MSVESYRRQYQSLAEAKLHQLLKEGGLNADAEEALRQEIEARGLAELPSDLHGEGGDRVEAIPDDNEEPLPVKGWLILALMNFSLLLPLLLYSMAVDLGLFYDIDAYDIMRFLSSRVSGLTAGFYVTSLWIGVAIIICYIYAAIHFHRRSRKFPALVVTICVLMFFRLSINEGINYEVAKVITDAKGALLNGGAILGPGAIVWPIYMLVSKRVKRTFIR